MGTPRVKQGQSELSPQQTVENKKGFKVKGQWQGVGKNGDKRFGNQRKLWRGDLNDPLTPPADELVMEDSAVWDTLSCLGQWQEVILTECPLF